MERRANGEGTIYNTIQKMKKEFDNTQMCSICKNCVDKSKCNNRQDWTKCEKCKNCKKDCLVYCDRFRCYSRIISQVYDEGLERHTVGTGKSKKEANQKKKDKVSKGKIVSNNNITLIQALNNFEDEKLKYEQIIENSYNRNINTVNSIKKVLETLNLKNIKIQSLTQQHMKDILIKFTDYSQSQLEKVYDELNGVIRYLYENDKIPSNIMRGIKRNTFTSNMDKKDVQAFSIDEVKQIIDYLNQHEDTLVDKKRSSYDCKTIKNFIKLAFATTMRCGELGAINIEENINLDKKYFFVETTLTKDKNGKIVIGKHTKTGKKKRKVGTTDKRIVPFDLLFPEEEIEEIVREQIEHSQSNPFNTYNLLFTRIDGRYIDHSQITTIFKRICRQAGVKLELADGCAIHMTKHTGVTKLIEDGMNIYVISKLVGTTVEVLQKTYAHVLDNFVKKEVQKVRENREEISITYNKPAGKIIPFRRTV